MTEDDRVRWDDRHRNAPPIDAIGPSSAFQPFVDEFPTTGHALDLACGRGSCAVWLARRGLNVSGFDVSPIAIAQAVELAHAHGVAEHCRFRVADLDDGLPTGTSANVVVCQNFRDDRLDGAILERLAPGGLLAISALSEVGAHPGRFRIGAGELRRSFRALDVIADGEADGLAWLLGRRGQLPTSGPRFD